MPSAPLRLCAQPGCPVRVPRGGMTRTAIRAVALWLRRQAAQTAAAEVDLQRARLQARQRVAGQHRDAKGRWTRWQV